MERMLSLRPSICFGIEKIIGVSNHNGSMRTFCVQWAPSWVSDVHLIGCEKLIEEFLHEPQVDSLQITQNAEPCVGNAEGSDNHVDNNCDVKEEVLDDGTYNNVNSSETSFDPLSNITSGEREYRNTAQTSDIDETNLNPTDVNSSCYIQNKPSRINEIEYNTDEENWTNVSLARSCNEVHKQTEIKVEESHIAECVQTNNNPSEVSLDMRSEDFVPSFSTPIYNNISSSNETYIKSCQAVKNLHSFTISVNESSFSKETDLKLNRIERYQTKEIQPNKTNLIKQIEQPAQFVQAMDNGMSYSNLSSQHHSDDREARTCKICGKELQHKSNMNRHVRTTHAIGDASHICSFCGKKFYQKSDLLRHMRKHTGEQPFQCQVCHKRFSWRKTLTRHVCQNT